MKRELTPDQIAKRDARRAAFKVLWKKVADMAPAQRLAETAQYRFTSCDGASYSGVNTLLIALQFRQATVLGGFRQWLKHGRAVRKGEHGISIWIPIGRKEKSVSQDGAESTSTDKVGFSTGTIFDISQTQEVTAGAQDHETEAA